MDRNMMARATSSDDSPTPGYMYGEIAKMTFASFEACKSIEEYVMKRLEKKNANVKRKTLLLIKHVARSGRAEFRRDLCRQLGPIKECLTFSGPPDPLRGDEIYVKVREAAKEALEAVTSNDAGAPAYSGRIEGYGSSPSGYSSNDPPPQQQYGGAYNGGGYGGAYNGGPPPQSSMPQDTRYEGYGNTPAHLQSSDGSYMSKAAALASGLKDRALDALATTKEGGYVGGNDRVSGNQFAGANSRMAGFGNPNFTDSRGATTWTEKATAIGRKAGNSLRNIGFKNDIKEDFSTMYASNRGSNAWPNANGGGYSSSQEGSYNIPPELASASFNNNPYEQQQQQPQVVTVSSSNAGGWGASPQPPPTSYEEAVASSHHQSESPANPRQRGSVGGVWGSMQQQQSQSSPSPYQRPPTSNYGGGGSNHPPPRSVGAANRDGEYERQLVNDLCAAGGTRAAPPPEKLADFVRAAATLDSDVVGPNLLNLLDDDQPTQVKCKALAVIEALALAEDCEQHKAYFAEVAGDLSYLASKPPITVQKNARKMLAALGYETSAEETTHDSRRAARRAPKQQDASFGEPATEEGGVEEQPEEEVVEQPQYQEPEIDLLGDFGDLEEEQVPVQVVPVQETTPAAPPPPPPAPPAATGGGLFDDLALKTPAAEQPLPTPDFSLLSVADEPVVHMPTPTTEPVDPFASAIEDEAVAEPPVVSEQPPPPVQQPLPPVSSKPAADVDPFSTLGELGGTPASASKNVSSAPATGPAFLASAHATPGYAQQQMMQQQQMQMNAQMVALMQQQQRLAAQQRHFQQQPYPVGGGGGGGMPSPSTFHPQQPYPVQSTIPTDFGGGPGAGGVGGGSAFSFMSAANDPKAKQADSFSFVSDMMK